jgi:purine-nucleoside phosphorylase
VNVVSLLVKDEGVAVSLVSLVDAAVTAIRARWRGEPDVALVLGTGLGHLAEMIEPEAVLAYREIPGFPQSTALAHKGQLVCGRLRGRTVVALQGRSHLYEGYPFEQLMFPTRTLAALGAKQLIVSNAAGGMNPHYRSGDVMLIEDVINLMFRWPTRSSQPQEIRPRFDSGLQERVLELARQQNIPLQRGVYVGVTGPNYETRAEYRFFRRIGGDAVGMSTLPEVYAAAECGLQVLGFSAITNVAKPDAPELVNAQEVVDVAELAAPNMQRLILALLSA